MKTLDRLDWMSVEVCLAFRDHSSRQVLKVPQGTTIRELGDHPALLAELREAWRSAAGFGVFGLPRPLDEPLEDGDRLEIWRPLLAEPKEARRRLARLRGVDAAAPRRRKS